ncbi:Ig-like domain-containing protein [uncultured Eubacterium sp.]|uniref:Ig-like domain-containing protein n=1 Tax=uncultured Eubacterium sp. TaxID=165185 RepID=UPI00259815BF|nr:Ig-like domain-containing protein [uncultured Eubacterium sp.]
MERLKKVIVMVLMMFLLIGIKSASVDAATINIGDIKDGNTEYYDEKDYVLKLSRPMKVKITLKVGQSQNTEDDSWYDDYEREEVEISVTDDDYSEITSNEVEAGDIFSKTIKLDKGKYHITVGSEYDSLPYSLSLKDVSTYTKKLKLNYKSISMYENQYVDLKASPKKKGYYLKTVQWKSSNKKIAKVDSNGRVTSKKAGSCTIYAKVKGGKKVKCKFKIYKRPAVQMTEFKFGTNSVGGIEPYIKIRNNTKKTIKYVRATVRFYNAVGDPAYCEITGRNYVNIRLIGPIKGGHTATYDYDGNPVAYNDTVSKLRIKSITVEFSDGTVKTYTSF